MNEGRATLAERAIVEDFDLGRAKLSSIKDEDVAKLAQHLLGYKYPLVYTAFDGDHFALAAEMRRYTLANGGVPVNPESVLGYFETVEARLSKRNVLLDDLALLRRCDQLWIFSDAPQSLGGLPKLSEGVLIELCFFLIAHPTAEVRMVPITPLLRREKPDSCVVEWTIEEVLSSLDPGLSGDILTFIGGHSLEVTRDIPPCVFAMPEVVDAKHYGWIRKYALRRNLVAVIPGMAVDLSDTYSASDELGCLLVSWVHLMSLCDRAWLVAPMDSERGMGAIQRTMESYWRLCQKGRIKRVTWREMTVPKAVYGSHWSVSRRGV